MTIDPIDVDDAHGYTTEMHNADQLIQRARAFRASGWGSKEQRQFVKVAKAMGYVGNQGGWIYRDGKCVTQGWQSLAMMLTGERGKHVTSQAR